MVNDDMQQRPEAPHDFAPLYALGILEDQDKQVFEEHLRMGCDGCETELKSLGIVLSHLGKSSPAEAPAHLRHRLVEGVTRTPQTPGVVFNYAGLLVSRSSELPWQNIAPGVEVKTLYRDTERKYHTSLVHMQPRARYPSHRHRGIEELFMLEGELHVEGQVARAGDYCRASSDSIHGETFTEGGCSFLVIASLQDEVIARQ